MIGAEEPLQSRIIQGARVKGGGSLFRGNRLGFEMGAPGKSSQSGRKQGDPWADVKSSEKPYAVFPGIKCIVSCHVTRWWYSSAGCEANAHPKTGSSGLIRD